MEHQGRRPGNQEEQGNRTGGQRPIRRLSFFLDFSKRSVINVMKKKKRKKRKRTYRGGVEVNGLQSHPGGGVP